jgi:hypothetical protein
MPWLRCCLDWVDPVGVGEHVDVVVDVDVGLDAGEAEEWARLVGVVRLWVEAQGHMMTTMTTMMMMTMMILMMTQPLLTAMMTLQGHLQPEAML